MSALESGNAMQHKKLQLWRDPYRNHAEHTRLKKILTPGLHKIQLDLLKEPNSFCPPNTDLVVTALIDVNVFELFRANSKRLYRGFLRHIAEFTLRLGDLRFDHTPSEPVDKKTGGKNIHSEVAKTLYMRLRSWRSVDPSKSVQ